MAIALIVMPTFGWRWLLILSSIPLFIFAIITPVCIKINILFIYTHYSFFSLLFNLIMQLQWLPESMVFDMTNGRTDLALSTLERVAKENKKSLPLGRLVMDRFYQASHGRFKDVLSKEMCKTSALLWLVW